MAATHATSNGWQDVSLVRWVRRNSLDLEILVGLAVIAATLRFVVLTDIPPGLHGDEAWTGLDARRILDHGWIGPYVKSAVGQPSGVLYLAAAFVWALGDTIFAIRAVSAVLGTATVLMAYITFRTMFDRTTATFSALLLAMGLWHLHFSRIAFTVISWPLAELITLFFLFLGLKTQRWLHFGLAGCALGLGVYTYNAYSAFVVALIAFLALTLGARVAAWWREHQGSQQMLAFVGKLGLLVALALVVSLPLLRYAADDNNDYFFHFRHVSYLETEQWQTASLTEKADIFVERSGDFIDATFWSGREDGADGSGENAMVDRVSLVLLLAGIVTLAWRWRSRAGLAVGLMILIIPLGAILTISGSFRRSFGMVPFLALLSALPLATAWTWSSRVSAPRRYLMYGAVFAVVAAIAYLNLSFYFGKFPDSAIAQETFDPKLAETANFMRTLPDDTVVYFYSGGYSFDYETVRFLKGVLLGEDRRDSLVPDQTSDVAYVFMDPYLDRIKEVEAEYPGGQRVDGGDVYQAYLLPRSQEPSFEGETPLDRDAFRIRDLMQIQDVLESYFRREGAYPNTKGTIQPLCLASERDAGCALLELAELPEDPLKDPELNGYFYTSDSQSYELYARREASFFDACEDHPERLASLESLLCVRGP